MSTNIQPPTLLHFLRAFAKAQQTRAALNSELDLALSTFLSETATAPTAPSASTCATESIRPPNEAELGEVLRIGFLGLMEVKEEVESYEAVLRVVLKREDLGDVLREIERLETARLKETIQRDQLRRLAVLDPDQDFSLAIQLADKTRQGLAGSINEAMQEITAEIAQLSFADDA